MPEISSFINYNVFIHSTLKGSTALAWISFFNKHQCMDLSIFVNLGNEDPWPDFQISLILFSSRHGGLLIWLWKKHVTLLMISLSFHPGAISTTHILTKGWKEFRRAVNRWNNQPELSLPYNKTSCKDLLSKERRASRGAWSFRTFSQRSSVFSSLPEWPASN